MERPSKARRRFHTDRIVNVRRKRLMREWRPAVFWSMDEEWVARKMQYGRLDSTDPWDCGNSRCGVCHFVDGSRRAREQRAWRREWL